MDFWDDLHAMVQAIFKAAIMDLFESQICLKDSNSGLCMLEFEN